MKKTIIALAIYFLGYIVAYQFTKQAILSIKKSDKTWTIGDRGFALIISTFSWATVLGMGIVCIDKLLDSKEPANW